MERSEATEGTAETSPEGSSSDVPPGGSVSARRPVSEQPMGRLSGVDVGGRWFQLQTEVTTQPEELIVTSVIRDGRVLQTTESRPAGDLRREEVSTLISKQHNLVEAQLRDRLQAVGRSPSAPEQAECELDDGDRERFQRFFKDGWARFRQDDLEAALRAWEQAYVIDPDNGVLQNALGVLRTRLSS